MTITSVLLDRMEEISDAILSCEQEVVLYKDPKLYSLVERLYFELLNTLNLTMEYYATSTVKMRLKTSLVSTWFQTRFSGSIAEIRRLSQAVQREVDYQHRLEMREASSRIIEMQLEQRKILTTLEDQRRILRSLDEERRIVDVVREQQRILQVVQQIQGAMQARALQGC